MDDNIKPADIPLVVDLDGTLIKADTLHEAFVKLLSRNPLRALRALLILKQGRAAFKAAIADHVLPDAATPVDDAVLDVIKQARTEKRKVYLATAADRRFAEAMASSIGEFDGVFGSEDGNQFKGASEGRSPSCSFWRSSIRLHRQYLGRPLGVEDSPYRTSVWSNFPFDATATRRSARLDHVGDA